MKRILSLMLAICMVLCMALPAMALEVEASGTPVLVLDSGSVSENEASPATTKVRLTVTEKEGNPLAGVKFGVYCDNGKLLEELTTNTDGTTTSGVLNEGNYYLMELEGVDGYLTDNTHHPFSIVENESILPVTVTNPRITGKVKVLKTDGDDNTLWGVEFGVFEVETDKEIDRFTTNWNGIATSKTLYYGDYYLKELSTQDGYELIDTPIPFSILEQDVVLEIPVTNPMIMGSVIVTKYSGEGTIRILKSGEDGAALSGVAFDVYRTATDEKVGNLLTDAAGITSMELPLGRYYLVETATVPGYSLLSGKASFALTEDGVTVELPIMNQKEACKPEGGHIRVVKRDADTSATLTGAIFGIYHASTNKYTGEIATGSDGMATSLSLPAGAYYLTELCAPEGYETDKSQFPVTVTTGGIAEITVTNKKLTEPEPKPEPEVKTGTVKIIKTDATDGNKRLSGASFSVYETVGGKKVGELLTGKDGTALLKLPEGGYTINETTAPEGYQLSTESISLQLKAGETRELTVKNSKTEPVKPTELGTLRIIKQDKDGGKKLKDAVFGVYRSDNDKKIGELTTGKDGTAELDLPVGSYYLRETDAPKGVSA